MRFRGLTIAAVLLLGLAVGLYFADKQKATEAAKPPADAPPKILVIPDGDITKVTLKKKTGDPVVLQKANNKWQMVAPKPFLVDQEAANTLAAAASTVSSDRVIEDKATDLASYGLATPSLQVEITTKDGKNRKLLFGDDTPTNSGAYAMLEGDSRLFTVASFVKTGLDKSVNDLRDKRLLTFDQDKLSRVELIAKHQDVEFGRDKDQWQIVKPKPLRADGLQIEELIRKLKDAKMDLAVSEDDAKKALASFAGGTPVATVKLTDPSGTQQVDVRKVKDDYYAKSSVVDGVHKVPADVGTGLDKGLDDFRNKKLFDFGFNDPNRIEMHDNGKAYSFEKKGEDWLAAGKKMDSTSVQSFLDKLRDFSATKFIDAGTFGAPVIDITVTSNDGKRVEKLLIAKTGSDYIAKRDTEPSLYGLDAKAVDELTRAASDVKPPAAPPPAPPKKK